MKLKNKIITILGAAAAATSVVTPLVLTTGCSCGGENSNVDYGVDVTEGYEADEKYLIEKGKQVKLGEGADKWFNYVKDHTEAPTEEAKWSGGFLATKTIPGMSYSSDVLEIKTKVNKIQADLKNFKVDDVANHRASYDISGYYDYEVSYNFKQEIEFIGKVDPIKVHLQLGFESSIKNTVLKVEDCSQISAVGTLLSTSLDPTFRPSSSRMGYDVWSVMPDINFIANATDDDTYSVWVKTEGSLTTYNENDEQLGVYGLNYERTINKNFIAYLTALIILSQQPGISTMTMLLSGAFEMIMSLCGWRSYVLSESKMIKRIVPVAREITWEDQGEFKPGFKKWTASIDAPHDEIYNPDFGENVLMSPKMLYFGTYVGDEPEYYEALYSENKITINAYIDSSVTKFDKKVQCYFICLDKNNFIPKWMEGFEFTPAE